jgi:indolepyruvate ferredoxin oxidoreductase beta subunit
MTLQEQITPKGHDPKMGQIIKLAVMAVGGQGGGVLAGWIEAVARAEGFAVQATSVAGVAQRTGATIYYLEMAPSGPRDPIFSLAPAAGDVDVLIAAEMMEAGRAILRGFVTPDRTTLIASNHRALAVSEKMEPGNGIADPGQVLAAAEIAAQRVIIADMEQLALANQSVISASLFGALAGAGVLPFGRAGFEEAIRAGGKGVEPSLRAFAAGFAAAQSGVAPVETTVNTVANAPPQASPALLTQWTKLQARAANLPPAVCDMAQAGLRKLVDYQDIAYASTYLDRLEGLLPQDRAEKGFAFTLAAAKHIANAMAYDDVIRVADLKTRAGRIERIKQEMGAEDRHLMLVTEFMHPRAEELVGLLPARLGRWMEARPRAMRLVDRIFNKGRHLRSDGLWAFLQLYALSGLRGRRRRSLRYAQELAHLEAWLQTAQGYLPQNYDLAVEILLCRRLIKGYSDTHARGMSKFDKVLGGAAKVAARKDGADWVRRLREAALKDEEGKALDGALATIRSFAG